MKRTKKYMMTASAAIVLSAGAMPVFAANFPDTVGNSHEVAIDELSQQGIITGYPDGTFKPNRTLTRSDVVKLLGKYLVTQGYSVPGDYKTNMRFSDLTPSSQDELLQYAAVVRDADVFKGNNGRLMPADFITRENMAVVLVRAYSEIKGFDFVSYVQGQTFERDVVDYAKAKAEARAAIEVLDYYNITGVPQYNPKNNTTRGQFAGFLYKWMGVKVPTEEVPPEQVLTVKSVTVTGPTTLRVVLSDNSSHVVNLPEVLKDNVETTVSFTIDGKGYTAKVTYAVEELKVAQVSAVNGAQLAITFNQKVKLDNTLTSADVARILSLASVDRPGTVGLAGGSLQADGRTLLVNTTGTALVGRYVVKIEGVRNEQNVRMTPYDEVVSFVADTTSPTIVSTTNTDAKTVVVKFSEPMQAYGNQAMQFKLENGASVTGITGVLAAGQSELTLDLTNARVGNEPLRVQDQVSATFTAARDVAGNMLAPNPTTVTFNMTGADGVKPTIEAVTQTGPKTFKLMFSERIVSPVPSDFYVARGNSLETITAVAQDASNSRAYYVTVATSLDGQYTIGTATNKFITDISGERNTFVTSQTFTQQTSAPIVETYSIVKEDNKHAIKLVFNQDVELSNTSRVRATGSYTLNGYTTAVNGMDTTLKQVTKREYVVELAQLLDGRDVTDATYTLQLQFTNVVNAFDVNAAMKQVNFTRAADSHDNTNLLAAPQIVTSVTDNALDNNTIKLVFAGVVDGVSATNKDNYTVQGAQVERAVVQSEARNIVWLTLAENSNSFTGERDVTISNVKAEHSTVVTPQMRIAAELKENVKPTAAVTREGTQAVKLTFSEAVQGVDATAFLVTVNNQAAPVTAVTMSSDNKTAILTLGTTIASSNVVKVAQGATMSNVKDAAGNVLQFDTQQFTYE